MDRDDHISSRNNQAIVKPRQLQRHQLVHLWLLFERKLEFNKPASLNGKSNPKRMPPPANNAIPAHSPSVGNVASRMAGATILRRGREQTQCAGPDRLYVVRNARSQPSAS
jgi:hypothetical protein